jgi:hypothetical protein
MGVPRPPEGHSDEVDARKRPMASCHAGFSSLRRNLGWVGARRATNHQLGRRVDGHHMLSTWWFVLIGVGLCQGATAVLLSGS